jgi:hypothetical protein
VIVWIQSRYVLSEDLGGRTEENHENLNQLNQCLRQDLNQGPGIQLSVLRCKISTILHSFARYAFIT